MRKAKRLIPARKSWSVLVHLGPIDEVRLRREALAQDVSASALAESLIHAGLKFNSRGDTCKTETKTPERVTPG